MDKLYDFNNVGQSKLGYGGKAGSKFAARIEEQEFLIKFPGNLKLKN